MKPKVIALIGPQGCGKSTLSEGIVAWSLSFADPIRRMLGGLLNRNADDLKSIDKTEPMEELCMQSYRHAAQTLGTEWGRNLIGCDIWINSMRLGIHKYLSISQYPVIIDDARFIDEFTMLREETDLLLLRINRDDIPDQANDHESEHYWAKQEPDGVIDNNGTLEESIAQIEKAIANKWGAE